MKRKTAIAKGWSCCKWDVLTVAGNVRFPAHFRFPFVLIEWDKDRWTLNHSLTNDCIKSHVSPYPLRELAERLTQLIPTTSLRWKKWDEVQLEIKPILDGWSASHDERL